MIQPLLRVVEVTRDTPLISNIEYCLERAKQEATKVSFSPPFIFNFYFYFLLIFYLFFYFVVQSLNIDSGPVELGLLAS